MTRTPLHLLLSGAVALAGLTACGGDSEDKGSPPPRTPSASPTPAPLTAAQAKAIAQASLLKPADLPGFESTPADTTEDPEDEKLEAEVEQCIGYTAPEYLADEASPDFSKGEPPALVEVSSEVQVVATEAEALAELEALRSDKALTCFQTFFDKVLAQETAEQGVTVSKFKAERFDVTPPAGVQETFGLRLNGSISAAGASFPVTVEVSGALVGRAELSVLAFGLGEPFPRAESDRLLALVAARAAKAQEA